MMPFDEAAFLASGFLGGFVLMLLVFLAARGRWQGENAALRAETGQQGDRLVVLEAENRALQEAAQEVREKAIRLEAEKEAFIRQIAQSREELKALEEKMGRTFENLSNRIFEQKSETFRKQSQENLGGLLNPLRERIAEFQKKVDDSFGEQAKEQRSLKDQIQNIVAVNEKMTLQAESLANALKGESKTQGDWGEIVLEKILEDSGLQKEVHYTVQGTGLDLRDAEGRLQKPDVIITLPEGKHIIIDSKVSLTHYERFFAEAGDERRPAHLKQFLASVRRHIDDLHARRYQDIEKLGTPDFVLMFIPIEGAYALAVQEDRGLHEYAWNKRVTLVCPTTLFAALRTISSVWRLEMQNRNAEEIARQGGALYDKIAGFVEDMQDLGKRLDAAGGTYAAAMNKLSAGRGNILGRAEKLRILGARASKALPAALLDEDGPDEEDAQAAIFIETEEAA